MVTMAIQACRSLIKTNVGWLRQALTLLGSMDDATYLTIPKGFAPHRVGGHLRHVIEFYECFLDGLESTRIDYDQRRRDESVERSRQAAAARLHFLIRRFEDNPDLEVDSRLAVRVENSVQAEWLSSSAGRELQSLSSHTIHHFALIALTARLNGHAVDAAFGMSPSTLRYESIRFQARTGQAA